jgi:uncharacterized membrane protein (Fun14 family)
MLAMDEIPESKAPRRPKFSWTALPRWKKTLLVSAGALFIGGGALKAYSFVHANSEARRGVYTDPSKKGFEPGIGNSFTDDGTGRSEIPPESGEDGKAAAAPGESLSPALMKGGLGFFLGFCMGYAIRTFFRISAFVIGAAALIVFGLMYAGLLPQPDWSSLSEHFNHLVARIKEQASGLQAFVEGNLHSTGAAAAGLFTGFKKN